MKTLMNGRGAKRDKRHVREPFKVAQNCFQHLDFDGPQEPIISTLYHLMLQS